MIHAGLRWVNLLMLRIAELRRHFREEREEGTHLMWQVEGGNAKWPETAEHREDAEAQVISGRQQQEGVFALWFAGVVTLIRDTSINSHEADSTNNYCSCCWTEKTHQGSIHFFLQYRAVQLERGRDGPKRRLLDQETRPKLALSEGSDSLLSGNSKSSLQPFQFNLCPPSLALF